VRSMNSFMLSVTPLRISVSVDLSNSCLRAALDFLDPMGSLCVAPMIVPIWLPRDGTGRPKLAGVLRPVDCPPSSSSSGKSSPASSPNSKGGFCSRGSQALQMNLVPTLKEQKSLSPLRPPLLKFLLLMPCGFNLRIATFPWPISATRFWEYQLAAHFQSACSTG
jgi:hypothetical protein